MDTSFLNTLDMKTLRGYAELISLKQNNPNKAGQRYLTSNTKSLLINKISHGLNNLITNHTQINGPNGTIYYRQSNILGQGGFGTVYKGYYKPTNGAFIPAAIKKNRGNANDLVIQNQNLHKIKNAGITDNFLNVYDLISQGPDTYLVIQLLDNYMDLEDALYNNYTMTQAVFEQISNQLMNTISLLHTNNFVHTDLKPANFMVQVDKNSGMIMPRIKIIDLGSLIEERPNVNNYNFSIVTPAYVKPDFQNNIFTRNFTFSEMKQNDKYAIIFSIFEICRRANLSANNIVLLYRLTTFAPQLVNYIATWAINP